jgi:uncharacterized protein (DUF2384 family)
MPLPKMQTDGSPRAPRSGVVRDKGHSQFLIASLLDPSGTVAIEKVADRFGMSKVQLARTVGLGPQAFYKTDRSLAAKTQFRVKEMLEIVSRVSDWAGGTQHAMAWYRAQPIAAFGGRTAESLVKEGKASSVRDYLDQIALGGFA